ncbi:MAG TPA: hypothetical protein VF706_04415, partial [Solirubrobacteraceae bacterium]
MSDVDESRSVNGKGDDSGVLTNLPRARPQRASARRMAARNGGAARDGGAAHNGAAARNGARKAATKA